MAESWRNEFNNATTNSSSEYMKPGNWLVRIDKIAEGENRGGVANFKLEGTIVHHFDGEQNVVASVTDMYTRKSDFFFSEVKALIAALAGKPSVDVGFDDLVAVSADNQPLKGIVVEYSAWEKESKNGFKFTKTACKGMVTKSKWLEVATPEEVERFGDLRFKKED